MQTGSYFFYGRFQKVFVNSKKKIENIFSNYISTIGEKTQTKIKYYFKNYTDYLTNEKPNSLFLSPIDKEEIELILSSLDIRKRTGPYSIPTKVVKLCKNAISKRLADLFNLLFATRNL